MAQGDGWGRGKAILFSGGGGGTLDAMQINPCIGYSIMLVLATSLGFVLHKIDTYMYACISTISQDKITAFQKVAPMYIQYILTFRKLEECYDQIVHPQKRRQVRHVLDGTMGR